MTTISLITRRPAICAKCERPLVAADIEDSIVHDGSIWHGHCRA